MLQIKHVIDYNAEQLAEYHKKTGEWNHNQGGFPQIAFYCFFTNQGNYKMYGYVAFDHDMHRAIWRKTKKEVIAEYTKSYLQA